MGTGEGDDQVSPVFRMGYNEYRKFIANICKRWTDSEFQPDWMAQQMTRKQRRRLRLK